MSETTGPAAGQQGDGDARMLHAVVASVAGVDPAGLYGYVLIADTDDGVTLRYTPIAGYGPASVAALLTDVVAMLIRQELAAAPAAAGEMQGLN